MVGCKHKQLAVLKDVSGENLLVTRYNFKSRVLVNDLTAEGAKLKTQRARRKSALNLDTGSNIILIL
jgi:alpha-D-ribose 1-methylphosphonate 5-triphosphate synthase subunit PhnI